MMAPGALDGLRVLDLSRVLAGPLAAQILSDLGADVIKIERPIKGDDSREWAPPTMVERPEAPLDESAYFWSCNRGKRSATADIATPQGQQLVRRLARDADVVIENYKVDTLARYGLDYATLALENPGLVYCSITGFGQTGPYRERPGYDTIVQAMGGLMSITGDADSATGAPGGPRKSGVAVADQMTALYSVVAILAALHERKTSGLGQQIDMALLDVQVATLTNIGTNFLATGSVPVRQGNRLSTVYPSDNFRCSDGDLMLIVGNDGQFRRLCEALGLNDLGNDPRFARNADRLANVAVLAPILQEAFARLTVGECERRLNQAGVPAAPINNVDQVFAHPQVLARELVREVRRHDGGLSRVLASPIRMSRSGVRDDRAPPQLGEHTAEVQAGWPIRATAPSKS